MTRTQVRLTGCNMPFASTCPDRRRASLALAALLTAGGASTPWILAQEDAPQSGQPAVFRSQTDMVIMQAAVVDSQERFVKDLSVQDFGVYEEGKRQEVKLFLSTAAPLDLMVLLDTSSSMVSRLGFAKEAAITLLQSLREGDQASIVLFSGTIRIAHDFSSDLASLEAAVRAASPGGTTSLYEAIYIAQRQLTRQRRSGAELRRKAIVVLSDGADNTSHVAFEDLLEDSRSNAVTIFTIVPSPAADPVFEEASLVRLRFQMRQLSADTGGRAFTVANVNDLASVYEAIAAELAHQYWLAYVPAPPDRYGFRRVSVRVETRPELRVRTRSGYYTRQRAERPISAVRPNSQ